MFCTRARSCARADDAKIVRSRDAQCKTRELPQGNSLVLHCASLLRTIFAPSARAHEHVHVQNVRDFPQTKLDNGINSAFLLNEHSDPRFFFSGIC